MNCDKLVNIIIVCLMIILLALGAMGLTDMIATSQCEDRGYYGHLEWNNRNYCVDVNNNIPVLTPWDKAMERVNDG